MAAPTVKVEIEFSAGSWTDVSTYSRLSSLSITVGRSDTDQRVQPGRLSGLVLKNNDGRFTVGNAAGAYYPNVASGKRVRVSIKDPVSLSYVPRFVGRIDGWPLSWGPGGTDCTVSISATDMLGDWATAKMPAYLPTVTASSPSVDATRILDAYFPCTEWEPSAGGLVSLSGGYGLADGGAAGGQFGTAGPPGDPRGCATFQTPADGSDTGFYAGGVPGPSGTGWPSWGATVWFQCDKPEVGTAYYPVFFTQGSLGVAVQIWPDGYAHLLTNAGGGWNNRMYATIPVCDGKWHLAMIACQPDGADTYATITVDGDSGSGGFGTDLTEAEVLGNAASRWLQVGRIKGAVGHVALWSLGYDRAPDHQGIARAGAGMFAADSRSCLNEIATLCGLTAPAGSGWRATLGFAAVSTGTALEAARLVEDSENGLLWAQPDGTVAFLSGLDRFTATTIALNLTADLINPNMIVAADRLQIANHVELINKTTSDLVEQTTTVVLEDAASIARHGRKDATLTTGIVAGTGGYEPYMAQRAGEMLVTAEAPRIPTLPCQPLTWTNANQSAVLAASVWDLIGVTGLPTAGGFVDRWLGRIEGWTETIGPAQWDIVYNVSAAGTRVGDSTFGLVGTARLA